MTTRDYKKSIYNHGGLWVTAEIILKHEDFTQRVDGKDFSGWGLRR